MVRKRVQRQDAIASIVRRERIRTQRELVERLLTCGYECTQATVSRDVTVMWLSKLPDGNYVIAEDLHLHRMISELVLGVVRSDKLVLVKASPGTAAGVAAALDAAGLEEVLGSIAGDDTVLVIAATEEDAISMVDSIEKHRDTSV